MADLVKELVGTWNVAFNQYRWTYTFSAGDSSARGSVTWRDIWNGKTGTGTWEDQGSKVAVKWKGSTTIEHWDTPLNPDHQGGNITASYASGRFSATKDQTRFDSVRPEGQIDAFACWAACLSWYTRASPDVSTTAQLTIVGMSDPRNWAANGSISLNGLMTLSLPSVFLQRSRVGVVQLEAAIQAKPFPMLIGFATGPMGGHVNVIHNFDEKSKTVTVMEPWHLDPAKDPNYTFDGVTYSNKKTGMPFKFVGAHAKRALSYYTSKPLAGQFVIGFNSKFSGRF